MRKIAHLSAHFPICDSSGRAAHAGDVSVVTYSVTFSCRLRRHTWRQDVGTHAKMIGMLDGISIGPGNGLRHRGIGSEDFRTKILG